MAELAKLLLSWVASAKQVAMPLTSHNMDLIGHHAEAHFAGAGLQRSLTRKRSIAESTVAKVS